VTALARWQHGEGEPFVLVHGFTGSSLDWTDVVEALAARRRVVTFDHRGHGESPHFAAEAEYSFEALLDDFATLVDELALERFDLLGHSMGGMVALRYALERPARVRSLVLMDTACEPIGGDGGMLHQGIGLAREHGLSNLTEVIVSFLGEGERAEVIKQRVRTKLSQMDVAAFCALGSELLAHGSVRSRLGEMAMPTTVIVGEHDTGLRPAADVLAAGIPGARLEVIAGAAHSPQEEQPDAWLAALDAHFDRLVTASK
jgi:pimeloyl-ACP methyl ester carboxylesterase